MTEKLQNTFFHISVGLAISACLFWTYFNFLAAEDANVLFNRFNHLSEAPIFFYYAGYSSAFPQFVAFSFSWLPTALQALLYSAVALFVFYVLLREIFLLTSSGLAAVFTVACCAVIYPAAIYNLTSSFWPGLAIVGLIGLRKSIYCAPFIWRDVFYCIPGLLGSPLAIVFFPLYFWIFASRRCAPSAVIAALALASYPLLANHSGSRGEPGGLLTSLVDNTSKMVMSPLNYGVNMASFGDLVMSILGLVSIAMIFSIGFILLFRMKGSTGKIAFSLFLIGSFATLGISIAASSVPLQGRYWFPVVVAAISVSFYYILSLGINNALRRMQILMVAMTALATVGTFAYRGQSWGGVQAGWSDWRLLASQAPSTTAIIRERHNDGGRWAIGTGNFEMTYSECAGAREHPFSQESFGFRIYCGEN